VTTCDDVRPLLTDHALGSLAPEDEGVVRRHLRGCASCRRELEALREGAGVFGSSLGRTPPPELRERVLEVLGEEWADADRTARPERRWGGLAVAAALVVALVAGAAAVIQTARAADAGDDAAAYRAVLATLGGTGFRVGKLEPAGATPVEGSVVAYESSHDQSFVVVFVRAPRLEGEGQLLASRADGTSWDPGPIAFDGDGDAAVWWVTDRSIASMSGLTVRAPDGSVLATASLRDD
jgi:anti-sigma factor RsiW